MQISFRDLLTVLHGLGFGAPFPVASLPLTFPPAMDRPLGR